MECRHSTLLEWLDPLAGDMHLRCQECGMSLTLTRAELIHASSARGEFRLSYRVGDVFGPVWAQRFWSQTRHGKKRYSLLNSDERTV